MSKAFDKVSHAQLIRRLYDFGFRGNLLKWFTSYLSNRYQQTTVGGATSRPLAVTSSVPQGSILGPLLFLLYENHLSDSVSNSNIATFAVDTKIFRTVNNMSDALSLQEDLTTFEENSRIPLCYWHEFLDLIFYFKCITGVITVNDNILPSIQSKERATRSTDHECLKFITPKRKTTTYQNHLCPGVQEYEIFYRKR